MADHPEAKSTEDTFHMAIAQLRTAIVRAARAVWRWLAAQEDRVIEDVLGVISLFVLLYAFLVAPIMAGWQ